jgi:hypothetical protein
VSGGEKEEGESERARTGCVAGPRALLGRASAAGLRERGQERTAARDWAARCRAELEKEESARATVLFFFFKNVNSVSFFYFNRIFVELLK